MTRRGRLFRRLSMLLSTVPGRRESGSCLRWMANLEGVLALPLIILWMSGCTAIKPLPIAARAGDSITIALGSQEGMTKNNTTATFTPDSTGVPVALTPSAIFNLYPDKRSGAYDASGGLIFGVSHEPWLTAMAVDLPSNLPVGFGTIKVNTSVPQPSFPNKPVPLMNYRLEILPGTGTPHDLTYATSGVLTIKGNLATLERKAGQAYIVPPVIGSCATSPNLAAIELTLQLPFTLNAEEGERDIDAFKVIAEDMSAYYAGKSPDVAWSAQGNELTVLFMSPDATLNCYEPRFSLLPKAYNFSAAAPPVLLSARYFDVNGAEVAGPAVAEYQVTVR